ncbi:MAG: c-type cytochrome, partial [Planctomycetales bacterium]|nr:c-type cytochrome [Planctomycetales bacterium]
VALIDACAATRPDPLLPIIAPWFSSDRMTDAWHASVYNRLSRGPSENAEEEQAERRDLLDELLPVLDAAGQQQLAQRAVATPAGTAMLVDLWERGRLSTRLLVQPQFAARVLASVSESDRAKVEAWQAALPPLSEEIEQRIAARKTAFTQQGGDIAMGQQLFTKHCAACHQIAGQGAVVGPQLDGIGLRGLDRLTEDLFDPNRNVDVAFRPTLLETEDGSTLAGLIKQESETTVTLVDNQGKEIVVDVETIVGRQPSTLSLMPDSLAADIPETDMLNLLAYLLSQKSRPE